MAGGGTKYCEGVDGVAENLEDTEQGRGETTGVRIFIYIHFPIFVALWCRDLGGYPPHGMVHGVVTGPGGEANYK